MYGAKLFAGPVGMACWAVLGGQPCAKGSGGSSPRRQPGSLAMWATDCNEVAIDGVAKAQAIGWIVGGQAAECQEIGFAPVWCLWSSTIGVM